MHHFARRVRGLSFLAIALGTAGAAHATLTEASTSATGGGQSDGSSHSGDASGTQSSANLVLPSAYGDVFISAQGMSTAGALRADALARSAGAPGDFAATASVSVADSFDIAASGYAGTTGRFSAAVEVSGALVSEFSGRAYADSRTQAHFVLNPHTGYNGGVSVADGASRNAVGYDIGGIQIHPDSYTLLLTDVPFTFGQPVDLSLSLYVSASIIVVDPGATGRSEADYGHTVTWSGLSDVRDQNGQLLTNFTALGTESGFDYARATPVPEPASISMGLTGGALLAVAGKRRRSAAAKDRAC